MGRSISTFIKVITQLSICLTKVRSINFSTDSSSYNNGKSKVLGQYFYVIQFINFIIAIYDLL